MAAAISSPVLTDSARDIAEGLLKSGQKRLPSHYLYDELGSALFEAITLLPEYGLTRADERLLRQHASDIASAVGQIGTVCELGSGTGKKTRYILQGLAECNHRFAYRPIDVSPAALAACELVVGDLAEVRPVCDDWIDGLNEIASTRSDAPVLLLFLGSSIGNLERDSLKDFLISIRSALRPGDFFLLGADLVKDIDVMLAAYDDPTGVTAAFNLNLLGRMNRELNADFDLRSFAHEAKWSVEHRRIEMHLLSCRDQNVSIGAVDARLHLQAGETIWTESSHKFSESELLTLARSSHFTPVKMWTDSEWPFAEALWKVE